MQIGAAALARPEPQRFRVRARAEECQLGEWHRRQLPAARNAVLLVRGGPHVHVIAVDPVRMAAHAYALDGQELLLEPDPRARVTGEIPRAPDHAMARDHDGKRMCRRAWATARTDSG